MYLLTVATCCNYPTNSSKSLTRLREKLEMASCYLKPPRVGEGERKVKAESSRGEIALLQLLVCSLLLSPVYLRGPAGVNAFPTPARGGGPGCPGCRALFLSAAPRPPATRAALSACLAFGSAAAGGSCAAGGCRAGRGGVG